MRLLLLAIGSRGDVQPLAALALTLQGRGHDVTLAAPPNFGDWLRGLGLNVAPFGPDVEAFTRSHAHLLNEPARFVPLLISTVTQATDELFRDLPAMASGMDAIVSGSLDMAGPSLAEAMGISHVAVQFYPGLMRSDEWPMPLLHRYDLPRWVNRLSWILGGLGDRTYFHRAVNGHRRRLGLAPFRGTSFDYVTSGGHSLLATDPALDPIPPDVRAPFTQTGFWFFEGGGDLSPELEAFLEAGDPPVYLGFGSMSATSGEALTRVLLDAVRRVGCRAVLSSGWAGLGGTDLPESVHVVGPVSHAALFPRMAAVVHHGGAGTTAMAARSGKPQVLVPHLLDQFHWARRVELMGLGPRGVPSKDLTADRLASALDAALRTFAYRAASERLAPILRERRGLEAAAVAIEALPRKALARVHP